MGHGLAGGQQSSHVYWELLGGGLEIALCHGSALCVFIGSGVADTLLLGDRGENNSIDQQGGGDCE